MGLMYVPDEIKDRIKSVSMRMGMNFAAILTEAIEHYESYVVDTNEVQRVLRDWFKKCKPWMHSQCMPPDLIVRFEQTANTWAHDRLAPEVKQIDKEVKT